MAKASAEASCESVQGLQVSTGRRCLRCPKVSKLGAAPRPVAVCIGEVAGQHHRVDPPGRERRLHRPHGLRRVARLRRRRHEMGSMYVNSGTH